MTAVLPPPQWGQEREAGQQGARQMEAGRPYRAHLAWCPRKANRRLLPRPARAPYPDRSRRPPAARFAAGRCELRCASLRPLCHWLAAVDQGDRSAPPAPSAHIPSARPPPRRKMARARRYPARSGPHTAPEARPKATTVSLSRSAASERHLECSIAAPNRDRPRHPNADDALWPRMRARQSNRAAATGARRRCARFARARGSRLLPHDPGMRRRAGDREHAPRLQARSRFHPAIENHRRRQTASHQMGSSVVPNRCLPRP